MAWSGFLFHTLTLQMQENIPLTIEKLSSEEENECRVSSAKQIRSLLHDMSEAGAIAALYYDGVKEFVMTSLLDVGERGLWVEQGVDASKNRHIAESARITLVSAFNQVKIQFVVGAIRAVTHQGYPAFYLPFPASLCRIQRREYYRLSLAPSERLNCMIPADQPPAAERVDVPVMDISGGGIRLISTLEDIEFVQGQVYDNCRIHLPEVGEINVTLIVKSLVSIASRSGQMIRRVGCEFKEIDTASGILLQRYVTMMQRLRAAA